MNIRESYTKEYSWYEPQNTGWSGGNSWFTTGETKYNVSHYETYEQAKKVNDAHKEWNPDPSIKYRVIRVTKIETHYHED
jgi:hypothetical protein